MEKVSVIMSTFNESCEELEKSIYSILNQTYKNIEFIIVNDNPANKELDCYLACLNDSRVRIIKNKTNMGLVASLNTALKAATGLYIARMDADDISLANRIERQIDYLKKNDLDMIGADVQIINEDGVIIQEIMHFPTQHNQVCKYIKWGTCLPHPTWLVKRELYQKLNGYRDVKSCEDYDFILRALFIEKCRLGNLPEVGLQYRVRSSGISKTTESAQYVLRRFLSKNRKNIQKISDGIIKKYLNSDAFAKEDKIYLDYKKNKEEFKLNHKNKCFLKILFNKYFYITRIENYYLKKREKSK